MNKSAWCAAIHLCFWGVLGATPKVSFSESDHAWSKSGFINHLNQSKRQSVENFNSTLTAIKEGLQKDDVNKAELDVLDAWAKKLLFSQEAFLKRVQQFKADATPQEVKNLKHDKLIGMYQARI